MSALARRLLTLAHSPSWTKQGVLDALRLAYRRYPVLVSPIHLPRPCVHAAPCACLFRVGGALEDASQQEEVMLRVTERVLSAEASRLFGTQMLVQRPDDRRGWGMLWQDGPSVATARARLDVRRWPRLALHRTISRNLLQAVVDRAAAFFGTPDLLTISGGNHRPVPGTTVILTIPGAQLRVPAAALILTERPIGDVIVQIVRDPRNRFRRPTDTEIALWLTSPRAPVRNAAFHLLGVAPGATG